MKKAIKTAALVAAMASGFAQADTESIKVICTDGERWDWVPSFQIVGEYLNTIQEHKHGYDHLRTFEINQVFYDAAVALCANYHPDLFYPQPVKGRYDEWYTFSVNGEVMAGRNDTRRPFNRNNEIHVKTLDSFNFVDTYHLKRMLGEEMGQQYFDARQRGVEFQSVDTLEYREDQE